MNGETQRDAFLWHKIKKNVPFAFFVCLHFSFKFILFFLEQFGRKRRFVVKGNV